MGALESLQKRIGGLFLIYLWAHLVTVPLMGLVLDQPVLGAMLLTLFFCGAAQVVFAWQGSGPAYRATATVASAGIVASMVYMLRGHPFQIDMHMYFFAALALSAAFIDRAALVAAAAFVAAHHLILNFTVPAFVFPDGANFIRVLFHAIVLIAETAGLIYIVDQVQRAFGRTDQALREAETAAQDGLARAAEAEAAQIEATAARDAAQAATQGVEAARAELESLGQKQRDLVAAQLTDLSQAVEQALAEAVGRVSDQTRQSLGAADRLRQSTDKVAGFVQDAAGASDTARQNTSTVASAAEQLKASIDEILRQIQGTNDRIQRTQGTAQETQQTVHGLTEAATRIRQVVGLIDEIAEQTNLLALNATIEAARAGEAGKGFAVVAGEVKSLANQTAKSTQEISGFVDDMLAVVDRAATAITEIGRQVNEVADAANSIAAAAEQQGAATGEIARSILQATQSVETVGRHVGAVADEAQGNAGLAAEMVEQAERINSEVGAIQDEIGSLIRTVTSRTGPSS